MNILEIDQNLGHALYLCDLKASEVMPLAVLLLSCTEPFSIEIDGPVQRVVVSWEPNVQYLDLCAFDLDTGEWKRIDNSWKPDVMEAYRYIDTYRRQPKK